jgi:hypothetical protein
MRLPVRAENTFQQEGYTRAWFHNLERAIQSLYLTLDTKSTPQTIARYLDGEVITLADFGRWAGKAIRYETLFQSIENKGLKNAISDLMPYQVNLANSLRNSPVVGQPPVGRPSKFSSAAARQRAYRERCKVVEAQQEIPSLQA